MTTTERTLTLTEAATTTGMSRKALARRVERGSIRSVLRDGIRRVPTSELVRVGLIAPEGNPVATPAGNRLGQGNHAGNHAATTIDLSPLLNRLEELVGENAKLRAIT